MADKSFDRLPTHLEKAAVEYTQLEEQRRIYNDLRRAHLEHCELPCWTDEYAFEEGPKRLADFDEFRQMGIDSQLRFSSALTCTVKLSDDPAHWCSACRKSNAAHKQYLHAARRVAAARKRLIRSARKEWWPNNYWDQLHDAEAEARRLRGFSNPITSAELRALQGAPEDR